MIKYKGKEVILMACSSCNIKRCEHCYISFKGDRDPKKLEEIATHLKGKHNVCINGAEVLVNKNYFNSYEIVNQDWMLTNGFAILKEPKILDFLKSKGINIVEMSFHFGIQDKISNVNNQMLEAIIELLKDRNMKYKLLVTVSSENYMMINEMCEKAILLGAYGIEFTNFLNQGNALNMDSSNILTSEQISIFFEQLLNVRRKYSKETLVIDRSGLFGNDNNNRNSHFNCTAGTDLVVITPDDNVYPCLFLAKPGFEIGKFSDGKIMLFNEIINDGQMCLAQEICNKNNTKEVARVLKLSKK